MFTEAGLGNALTGIAFVVNDELIEAQDKVKWVTMLLDEELPSITWGQKINVNGSTSHACMVSVRVSLYSNLVEKRLRGEMSRCNSCVMNCDVE